MPSPFARWAAATAVLIAAAATGLTGVTAAEAATDTSPPVVSAAVFTPTSVDDTAGDTQSVLKLHIVDPSGFNDGSVTLVGTSTTLDPIDFNNSSRTAGSTTAGDFAVEIDIPQGTPAGTYVPTAQATDTKNNAGSTTFAGATLTVNRTADSTPPALAGQVTVTPSTVDVSRTDQTVTFSAHLTDAVPGVADAAIALVDPAGATTTLTLARAAGTANDGVWTADYDLPTSASRGTWSIGSLTAHDAYGNFLSTSTSTSTTTTTNELGPGLTVTGAMDTTGPKLVSVTPASPSADTTSGAATVRLSVHATDDVSGLDFGTLTFTSPDGSQAVTAYVGDSPVTGTAIDGIWHPTVTFPVRAQGTWSLTSADLYDAQGNESWFGAGATKAPSAHITLDAADDDTAPTLAALSLGPAEVTTAYADGDATVDGHVTFADDRSALDTVDIALRGPDGTVDPDDDLTADLAADPDDDLTAGNGNAGVLSFAATLPQADPGIWTVDSVRVTDHAGNSATYSGTVFGSPSFTVVTTAADTLAPELTALTVAPQTPQTPQTAQPGEPVSVAVGAVDPGAHPSGVAGGSVVLQSPAGDQLEFDLDGAPVSGDSVAGTYADTQTLDADATADTWTVVAVTLFDAAGNTTALTGDQVAAAVGSAPTLTVGDVPVTSGATVSAPFAPSTVRATAAAGRATITFAPADDGGSVITSYRVAASTGGGSCATVTTTCTVTGLQNGRAYTFTVTATNAVGTSAASAPTDAVTPRAGTRLAIDPARASVRVGSAARVSGKLIRTDANAPLAGQLVALQYRRAGTTGSFITFAIKARTAANGAVAFTGFTPRYAVEVRLYFPTAAAYGGSVSTSRRIAVTH